MSCQPATRAPGWGVQVMHGLGSDAWHSSGLRHEWMARWCSQDGAGGGNEQEAAGCRRRLLPEAQREGPASPTPAAGRPPTVSAQRGDSGRRMQGTGREPLHRISPDT